MIDRSKDLKKASAGMKKAHRKKRLSDVGNRATLTRLGKDKVRADRIRSGRSKIRTLRADFANVFSPKEKKFIKASIRTVSDTPSNRHYARANIITKGSVLETELGKARVTNRPGQEGVINAVLL